MNELKAKLDSYAIKVTPLPAEDGGGFIARYEELGLTVRGVGDTVGEAIAELEDLALDTLDDVALEEFPSARQEAPWADYSGRVTLRLPKMLHAQLDRLADEQGVSLNQFMSHSLQAAATATLAGEEFGVSTRRGADEIAESVSLVRGLIDQVSIYAMKEKAQVSSFEKMNNQWAVQKRSATPLKFISFEEAMVA